MTKITGADANFVARSCLIGKRFRSHLIASQVKRLLCMHLAIELERTRQINQVADGLR